jgi:hypothetical protein
MPLTGNLSVTVPKKGEPRFPRSSFYVKRKGVSLETRDITFPNDPERRRHDICEALNKKKQQRHGCFTKLIFHNNKPVLQVCDGPHPKWQIDVKDPADAVRKGNAACKGQKDPFYGPQQETRKPNAVQTWEGEGGPSYDGVRRRKHLGDVKAECTEAKLKKGKKLVCCPRPGSPGKFDCSTIGGRFGKAKRRSRR